MLTHAQSGIGNPSYKLRKHQILFQWTQLITI